MDLQALQRQIEEAMNEVKTLRSLVESVQKDNQDLNTELQAVKDGQLDYIGLESIKRNIFEGTKPNSTGTTPIYTSYNYGGVGTFAWSSTNSPDNVLVINILGKRYWIPVFTPN